MLLLGRKEENKNTSKFQCLAQNKKTGIDLKNAVQTDILQVRLRWRKTTQTPVPLCVHSFTQQNSVDAKTLVRVIVFVAD